MAKQFAGFDDDHRALIAAAPLFFVATAAATGRVNLSPKGMDSLRVTGPNSLVWLNLTGSGNETAGHLRLDPRMTVMWCGFGRRPVILRAYGTARALHPRDAGFAERASLFGPQAGARQVVDMAVEMVQTSCGFAVPMADDWQPRDTLARWAEAKGPEGVSTYWAERNTETIDGFATGILPD